MKGHTFLTEKVQLTERERERECTQARGREGEGRRGREKEEGGSICLEPHVVVEEHLCQAFQPLSPGFLQHGWLDT